MNLRSMVIFWLILRLALVFIFPRLSDDIYRFIWDGQLMHSGIHPLSYTPKQWMEMQSGAGEWQDLFELLNSQEYYTVYPPLSQLIYYLATFSITSDYSNSAVLMKLMVLAFESLGLFYLWKLLFSLGIHRSRAFIYYLNPLILVELGANLHFEGVYIALFFVAVYYLSRNSLVISSFFWSSAVAVKLLPIMFLPLLFRYFGNFKELMRFYLYMGLMLLLLFVPFFWGLDILHFLSSLDLYFQSFEFNASIYYILRYAGRLITGYNQIAVIGPLLALATLSIITYLSYKSKVTSINDLLDLSFIFFLSYLLLATTLHPWYLAFPVAMLVFRIRIYVLLWSFTIIFSYSRYAFTGEGHFIWIGVEYGLVLICFILEKYWMHKKEKALIR